MRLAQPSWTRALPTGLVVAVATLGPLGRRLPAPGTGERDPAGLLSFAETPQVVNPAQGYLASANQQPIDPTARDDYHGSDWPSPWRAMEAARAGMWEGSGTSASLVRPMKPSCRESGRVKRRPRSGPRMTSKKASSLD